MIVVLIRNRNCYINKFYAEKPDVRILKYRSVRWVSDQFIIHTISSLNTLDHNSPQLCSMYIIPHAPNNIFSFNFGLLYSSLFYFIIQQYILTKTMRLFNNGLV